MLAARAKVGSYYGPGFAESPPDMLFFAGGGGSVRGYAYQSIGVESFECGADDPCVVGGKGLAEGSAEARYRINERFGAAGFVDVGFVTESPKLSGETDLRFGVGLGLRYYTPIGPLRFDLATPIDRRPEDFDRGVLHRDRTGVLRRLAALLGLLVLVAIAALAQTPDEPGDDDNGFLINLLERQLSTPTRQIRLSGVSGALSSNARIARITISDPQGTWLEIDNAEIDWRRLSLLRGRVNINRLSAERIAWTRRPGAEAETGRRLPQAEAQPFALPELPVSINIAELSLPSVTFGEPVFGQAAALSASGRAEPGPGRARREARHPAHRRPGRQPDAGCGLLQPDAPARRRPGAERAARRDRRHAAADRGAPGDRADRARLRPARPGGRELRPRRRPAPAGRRRGGAARPRRGARLPGRLRRRARAADPGDLPRLLRRPHHRAGRGPEQGGRRAAHRGPGRAGARAAAERRPRDRRGQLPAKPEPDRAARGPGRAGGGAAGARRADPPALRDALPQLRRRDPLERAAGARPPGGGRHRDGGRHLPAGRAGAEPRRSGAAQRDGERRGAGDRRLGRGSEGGRGARQPHRPLRRRGAAARRPGHAEPGPDQRQRPVDLHRRRDREPDLHRAQLDPGRRHRDLRRARRARDGRRGGPEGRRQRDAAERGLRPDVRGQRQRPRARRRAPRRAAGRRDHALRAGGARRGRVPHREPAGREPAALASPPTGASRARAPTSGSARRCRTCRCSIRG